MLYEVITDIDLFLRESKEYISKTEFKARKLRRDLKFASNIQPLTSG